MAIDQEQLDFNYPNQRSTHSSSIMGLVARAEGFPEHRLHADKGRQSSLRRS